MDFKILYYSYQSSFGELLIGEFNESIILCDWKYRKMRKTIDKRVKIQLKSEIEIITTPTPLIELVINQLEEYSQKKRDSFDFPINLIGSDFQVSIWNLLLKIPYGKTISYEELAYQYGDKKAIRAVASANGANAISIIIPCHRVIGKDGKLNGYAGGIPIKRKLLKLEGAITQKNQLKLPF